MLLLIISGALAFTQMLAFLGATEGLVDLVLSLSNQSSDNCGFDDINGYPLQACSQSPVPIMLVTLPVLLPVVEQLGFDPIRFAVLYLIAIETGSTSPPFGAGLFVMKGVAPRIYYHE